MWQANMAVRLPQKSTLFLVPKEVWAMIWTKLSHCDMARARRVCKAWNASVQWVWNQPEIIVKKNVADTFIYRLSCHQRCAKISVNRILQSLRIVYKYQSFSWSEGDARTWFFTWLDTLQSCDTSMDKEVFVDYNAVHQYLYNIFTKHDLIVWEHLWYGLFVEVLSFLPEDTVRENLLNCAELRIGETALS